MQKFFLWLLLAAISLNFSVAEAQTPYKLTWGKEGIIAGTAVLTGVPAIYFATQTDTIPKQLINALKKSDINGFDRFAANYYSPSLSKISDYFLWTCAATPALLLFSPEVRGDWFTLGTMYAEAVVLTTTLTEITKGLAKRYRPFAYDSLADMDARTSSDTRRSFFSGHTSLAFTSAVFLSKVFSDLYPNSKYRAYVWTGSLLLAATVGTMRIFSGKHFPTDVITGAAVGSAFGWLIPELHKVKKQGADVGIGLLGISISYSF